MIRFLYSYAEKLLRKEAPPGDESRFAIVIENGEPKNAEDILEICRRVEASPLFVALSYGDALRSARRMSRYLAAPLLIPRNLSDFKKAVSTCAFSVCDGVSGAILSLLSYTPAYLDVEYRAARELIATATALSGERAVIVPYKKSNMKKIKKVGAQDSDFIYLFERMKQNIESELQDGFNPLYPPLP